MSRFTGKKVPGQHSKVQVQENGCIGKGLVLFRHVYVVAGGGVVVV